MILLLFESILSFPDQSSPYFGKIKDVRNILLTRTIASITARNIIGQLFVLSASLKSGHTGPVFLVFICILCFTKKRLWICSHSCVSCASLKSGHTGPFLLLFVILYP